jgi:DNA-directed RNA polymerase subunit M/transcription elongation factor TFIIS
MVKDYSSGSVEYKCRICGNEVQGTPNDARISKIVLGVGETIENYERLIKEASNDRTDQIVKKTCEECGLDYMTQIRVGSGEVIIYKCKCGATAASRHN